MTGWKRAISGNFEMALLRMDPPRLEINMADRTGVHPVFRISAVSLFNAANLLIKITNISLDENLDTFQYIYFE